MARRLRIEYTEAAGREARRWRATSRKAVCTMRAPESRWRWSQRASAARSRVLRDSSLMTTEDLTPYLLWIRVTGKNCAES